MEKMPVSLVGITHLFGERIVNNADIEEKYGLPTGWVLEKTGKEKGHAWEDKSDAPVEASLKCLDFLLAQIGLDKSKIEAVFGTTNPIIGDVESTPSLTQKFAIRADFSKDIKISDEGFGCGGSAVGIDSMYKWFQSQPTDTYAVYVTQDWSTKMVKERNTEALFSDAVSVSLWTNGSDGTMEIVDVFSSESTISDDALGIVDGFWKMDGKEVSDSASAVPKLVAEKLNINLNDYYIVPHQPNAKLLETMEKIYDVEFHKRVAIEHGNPTCSGALIALEYAIEDRKSGVMNKEKDILVMPFGAGGTGGFILRNKKI